MAKESNEYLDVLLLVEEYLKNWRKEKGKKGINQTELSKKGGISAGYYRNIASGQDTVPNNKIDSLIKKIIHSYPDEFQERSFYQTLINEKLSLMHSILTVIFYEVVSNSKTIEPSSPLMKHIEERLREIQEITNV